MTATNAERAALNRARERAEKLRALAGSTPFPAEAQAATRALEKLLADHGLTLADLTGDRDERVERLELRYSTATERMLALHIFAQLQDDWQPTLELVKGSLNTARGTVAMTASPYTCALGRAMWRAYRPALAQHLDNALVAFLGAHRIVPPTAKRPALPSTRKGAQDSDPNADSIMRMAGAVQPVDLKFNELDGVNRALTSGRNA